jgi:hypothetical protein
MKDRSRHHRPRHGLRLLRRPAGRTRRPSRQRRAPFRGGLRRPQSRRAQAGGHVARRRRRGAGRGIRQARLPRAARSREACRRAARGAALPAARGRHPRALRCPGAATDPGRGRNAQPRCDAGAQPRPARIHLAPRRLSGLVAAVSAGLRKVAELVSSSSWAAAYLQRHPILLDELLDPRLLDVLPDWSGGRKQLTARLDELEPDTERQMDLLREAHHAQVFRLLAQDVAGLYTVEKLADHLSELADILLDAAIARAWLKMPKRHIERRSSPSSATASSAARNSASPPTSTWSSSTTTRRPKPAKTTRGSAPGSTPGSRHRPPPGSCSRPTCGCGPTANRAWS